MQQTRVLQSWTQPVVLAQVYLFVQKWLRPQTRWLAPVSMRIGIATLGSLPADARGIAEVVEVDRIDLVAESVARSGPWTKSETMHPPQHYKGNVLLWIGTKRSRGRTSRIGRRVMRLEALIQVRPFEIDLLAVPKKQNFQRPNKGLLVGTRDRVGEQTLHHRHTISLRRQFARAQFPHRASFEDQQQFARS